MSELNVSHLCVQIEIRIQLLELLALRLNSVPLSLLLCLLSLRLVVGVLPLHVVHIPKVFD